MRKRLLSMAVVVLLIVSTMNLGAFALTAQEFEENFSNYASEGIPSGFYSGNNTAIVAQQTDGSFRRVYPTKGVLGKAADDTSLILEGCLNNKNSLTHDLDGNAYQPAFGTDPHVGFSGLNRSGKLYVDDVVYMGGEMAALGTTAYNRYFYLSVYNKEKTRTHARVFETTGTTILSFKKEVKNVKFYTGRWYKVDAFLYPDGGFELYINGIKAEITLGSGEYVGENGRTYLSAGKGGFDYIDFWRVGSLPKANNYGHDITAVDNCVLKKVSMQEAEALKPTARTYAEQNIYEDFTFASANSDTTTGIMLRNYNAKVANVVSSEPRTGLFGKAADDVSFLLSNNSNTMPEGVGVSGNANQYLTNPYYDLGVLDGIKANDIIRIGFNMAVKDRLVEKFMSIRSTGVRFFGEDRILIFYPNGNVVFFNEGVASITLVPEKWYNVEIIIKTGENSNTADLYINGQCVKKDKALYGNDGKAHVDITRLDFMRIGYDFRGIPTENSAVGPNNEKLNYKPEGMYLDDVVYEVYRDGNAPDIEETMFSHSDIGINSIIFQSAGKILAPSDLTVLDFKNGLSCNSTFYMVDESGNPTEEGMLKGKKIILTAKHKTRERLVFKHSKVFLDTTIEPITYADEGFSNDVVFSYSSPYPYPSDTRFNTHQTKNGDEETTVHYMKNGAGLGAKPISDRSFEIETVNFNPTGGAGAIDPYLTYEHSSNIFDVVTVEVSLLARGKDAVEYRFDAMIDNDSKKSRALLTLRPDGYMYSLGKQIGPWEENRWYRVAATLYTGTAYADVYINGVKVYDKIDLAGDLGKANFYKRFKGLVIYPTAEGNYNGCFALDDFRIYEGLYQASEDIAAFVSENSNYVIDENNKLIFVKEQNPLAMSVLGAFNRADLALYADNTFQTAYTFFEPVTTGNIIVCKSTDAPIYSYYKIILVAEDEGPDILADGEKITAMTAGNISARAYVELEEDESATLIVASYINGKLDKVNVKSISGAGYKMINCPLGTINDITGVKVKAMLVDSLENMVPLTPASVVE